MDNKEQATEINTSPAKAEETTSKAPVKRKPTVKKNKAAAAVKKSPAKGPTVSNGDKVAARTAAIKTPVKKRIPNSTSATPKKQVSGRPSKSIANNTTAVKKSVTKSPVLQAKDKELVKADQAVTSINLKDEKEKSSKDNSDKTKKRNKKMKAEKKQVKKTAKKVDALKTKLKKAKKKDAKKSEIKKVKSKLSDSVKQLKSKKAKLKKALKKN